MKIGPRSLIVGIGNLLVLVSIISLFCVMGTAQRTRRTRARATGSEKVEIKCPVDAIKANGILGCPDTGCGTVDPLLNKRKNDANGSVESAEDKDFNYLADLPKKVEGYDKIGDPRDKLSEKGEGKMIRVVAYALDARKGSKESCNCGLKTPKNTDNHIVLVDEETLKLKAKATPAQPPSTKNPKGIKARSAEYNTLKRREKESETAEFAPRVRVKHPGLVGAELKALIMKAPNHALLVRVTGLHLYDSEHALGGKQLLRHNDWEIHPVFKMEYCPKEKQCGKNSSDGWVSMDRH